MTTSNDNKLSKSENSRVEFPSTGLSKKDLSKEEVALAKQEIRRMQSSVNLEDTLNALVNKSLYNTTETGFERFDEMLDGGVRDGRLYVLGATSSLGKTTFALNIADNVATAGRTVLIFSLEMSRVDWQMKSLSRQTYHIVRERLG